MHWWVNAPQSNQPVDAEACELTAANDLPAINCLASLIYSYYVAESCSWPVILFSLGLPELQYVVVRRLVLLAKTSRLGKAERLEIGPVFSAT
jgi:hypothetical protein